MCTVYSYMKLNCVSTSWFERDTTIIIIIIIIIIVIIIIIKTLVQEATHLTTRQSSMRASNYRKQLTNN